MTSVPWARPVLACSLAVVALALGACNRAGGPASVGGSRASGGAPLQVVAAENVWGSIALQLAGTRARVASIITNPNSSDASEELRDVQNAARATGQELVVVAATSDRDFEAAFAMIIERHAQVLLISMDPFLIQSTPQIIALAAQHRIPAVYATSESVAAGGLISYGASISNAWRLAGVYAGTILKGTRPAELPVVQPTEFELALNLKTAKALGLTLPPTLLARADEVIE